MAKEKEKEKESRRIVLFVAVASRGQGEKIATYCAGCGGKIRLIALGRGTASQDILNYLGLGDSKKDVVFCTASRPAAQKMLLFHGKPRRRHCLYCACIQRSWTGEL